MAQVLSWQSDPLSWQSKPSASVMATGSAAPSASVMAKGSAEWGGSEQATQPPAPEAGYAEGRSPVLAVQALAPEAGYPDGRLPTGAQVCRSLGIPNQGPRAPMVGARARDHKPVDASTCAHLHNTHGGNQTAYYVQCVACKHHIEYYPKKAAGMDRVQAMMEFLELQRKLRARAKTKNRAQQKARAKPTAAPSSTPTAQPTEDIEAEIHQVDIEAWQRRVEAELLWRTAPATGSAVSEAASSRKPCPGSPSPLPAPTPAPPSEPSWVEAGSTVQSVALTSEGQEEEAELLTPRTMMIRAIDRFMTTNGANELCNRLFDHLGVEMPAPLPDI